MRDNMIAVVEDVGISMYTVAVGDGAETLMSRTMDGHGELSELIHH